MSTRKVSNSSSEDDRGNRCMTMDEKKRKRMISNRESARRSRIKRELHIKDLNDQTLYFTTRRSDMVQKIDEVTRRVGTIESENKILRKQGQELNKRLELLEDMLASYNHINSSRFMYDLHGMVASKEYSEMNILMKSGINTPFQPQAVDGITSFDKIFEDSTQTLICASGHRPNEHRPGKYVENCK
ncbi:ocs element-binding factor 1-like [Dorcoceras hygrometricum]|uniref:Ocs element-binding factor 1-like n=1 Tax=Dorcoceras hygrometricum TaxID=472368 RepID=A0A2Z7B080_9LAMI|nr:ocs element-binding factor 1-like [Dorcoceras hygrometricum]